MGRSLEHTHVGLGSHEVHVWFSDPELIVDERRHAWTLAILDPSELDRLRAFRFERDRLLYIATHGLLRRTLSRYAPVPPDAWRFVADAHGRPEVAGTLPDLRFSVSHTTGLVACAVARTRAVGVDVEATDSGAPLDVAERFFAPTEVAALDASPSSGQVERFFAYWTLKEAYLKARGLGLNVPLNRLAFHLSCHTPPCLAMDPMLRDGPETWQFRQLRPTARHLGAICVARRGYEPTVDVIKRWEAVLPA